MHGDLKGEKRRKAIHRKTLEMKQKDSQEKRRIEAMVEKKEREEQRERTYTSPRFVKRSVASSNEGGGAFSFFAPKMRFIISA